MKNIIALSLVALTAVALTPSSAHASRSGDKALAAVGGFIGGVIVGSAINHHDRYPSRHETRVIVDRDRDHCDDGYWKEVSVRTWVPGYWATDYRHGRRIRYYVDGYHEHRIERVWVSYDRYDRRDDRHGSYGYGYGPGRRR